MKNILLKIWDLYYDGFKNMTLGRILWAIILTKLFIMFFVLKLFFFPNYLKELPNENAKSSFVSNELIDRAVPSSDAMPIDSDNKR